MRWFLTSGSVRGVARKGHPYRDLDSLRRKWGGLDYLAEVGSATAKQSNLTPFIFPTGAVNRES